MNSDPSSDSVDILEIIDWVESLRRLARYRDISYDIQERMERATSLEERKLLYPVLIDEHVMHSSDQMAENALARHREEFPDDERTWIKDATFYLYVKKDPRRALSSIENAVRLSRRSGKFRRESCGVKARAALAADDVMAYRGALEEMVGFGPNRDAIDVGVETDFVEKAPSAYLSDDLRLRYEELYRSYWNIG